MQCLRCGTVLSGRFCHACGFDVLTPSYLCPRCGAGFAGFVCPFCGLPVGSAPYAPQPQSGTALRSAGTVIWSAAMVLFVVLLVAELATLAYTSGLVINGSLAGGPLPIDLYVLAPYPVGASYDVPASVFLAYYTLLVVSIALSYAHSVAKDGRLTVRTFVRPIAELSHRFESRSAIVATGQVFLAIFFFQGAYLFALWLVGFVPEAPTFPGTAPDWYPYFALTNASVYEEFATRLLYVGVPLFLGALALSFGRRGSAPSLGKSRVSLLRHLLGGTITRDSPRSMILLAGVFLLLSSLIFGLAHVPAWGWWKFPPTFVAGLALGYLFLRSGLFAAILFHFATDYLAAMALLTEGNIGALAVLAVVILTFMAFGAVFFGWYLVYVARLAAQLSDRWWPRPQAAAVAAPVAAVPPYMRLPTPPPVAPIPPTYMPPRAPALAPSYGTAPVAYTCPRCGWREARYAEGRFTCLRCGQVS